MDPILGLAIAGGAVALVYEKQQGSGVAKTIAPVSATAVPVRPSGATTLPATKNPSPTSSPSKPGASIMSRFLVAMPSSFASNGLRGQTSPSEIDAAVTKKASDAWDKLGAPAKKAACDEANKLAKQANPNAATIPCGSFKQILAALAAVAGTAGCVAIGVGAVVSPLCGMVAAWITNWAYDDLAKWTQDAYNEASNAASGIADKVGSAVKDAANEVGNDVVNAIGSFF